MNAPAFDAMDALKAVTQALLPFQDAHPHVKWAVVIEDGATNGKYTHHIMRSANAMEFESALQASTGLLMATHKTPAVKS